MISLIKCEECLQLTGFCLSLGSHVNTGRFQSSQDLLKGDEPIGAIVTWFPGSTFWWMPCITHICKIANTYTKTQWESCIGNLYADVHIKFSQSVLNQIWVIDFTSVCALFWLRKVCVQVLTSYLCAPDSLFVNCPKLTFTSITTNPSLTHTELADPFLCCPLWSLSLFVIDRWCDWLLSMLSNDLLNAQIKLSAVSDWWANHGTHTYRKTCTHLQLLYGTRQVWRKYVCVKPQKSRILLAPNQRRISVSLCNVRMRKG